MNGVVLGKLGELKRFRAMDKNVAKVETRHREMFEKDQVSTLTMCVGIQMAGSMATKRVRKIPRFAVCSFRTFQHPNRLAQKVFGQLVQLY